MCSCNLWVWFLFVVCSISPFGWLPSRIFFWLFPLSSALRSLAARPSSARLSSFPLLPQLGCFHSSSSFILFPWFPPLITVKRMTPFLLLFRFLSAFFLLASVLLNAFLPSILFCAPLRFLRRFAVVSLSFLLLHL